MIARVLLGPRPPKRARLPRPERAPSLLPGALLSVLSALPALSALLVLLGAVSACKDSPPALAELVQVSGSGSAGLTAVERATGADDWRQAKLGTKFFLGDAARTGDATAQLRLGDASRLAMEPHTILRFGRRGDTSVEQQLLVELGSIELVGSGAYQFDIGEISVERNGGVRISAADDGSRVELLVGQASIRTGSGAAQPLQPGAVLQLSDIEIRKVAVDAAPVADAGVTDAAPAEDAALSEEPALVAVATTGKGGELRTAADSRWRPIPRDTKGVEPGASVRARSGGTVKLDNGQLALQVESGGVATVGPGRALSLTSGAGTARTAPGAAGEVALPGGKVALAAHRSGSRTELTVSRRESRVRATGGALALHGRDGSLALRRGESASLSGDGALRALVAVPAHHDLSLSSGDSVTIHDVRGAAAVQFRFADRCPGDGVIELDKSAAFRSPQQSSGQTSANLLVSQGSYHYRLRCETASGDSRPLATGRISLVRDAGRRPLAAAPPPFSLEVDGRTYRVGYQGAIPAMNVQWKGASGRGFVLHLAQGGKDQSFPAGADAVATIPGARLKEGTHTLWFEREGKRSKISTLIIDFDNTAPAVYIDEPDDGEAWGQGVIAVKGAVLPDWAVTIDGVALPLDKQRRFSASVPVPKAGALAIRLSHPQRGVHYYLRRPR